MMNYSLGVGPSENWLIAEEAFSVLQQGKCESIFYLANGYMGLRSATEERYPYQTRDTFVAGTFNKFDDNEVTELPNAADSLEIEILIDGEPFSLQLGHTESYRRSLNLQTGEVVREIVWQSPQGKRFALTFKRFVSQVQLHVLAQSVSITALSADASLKMVSGINGQLTNSGSQHFHEGDKRIFDGKIMQMTPKTTQSKIDFVHHAAHRTLVDGMATDVKSNFGMDRRKVFINYNVALAVNQTFTFEKIHAIHTSRDLGNESKTFDQLKEAALTEFTAAWERGYDALFAENVQKWADFWQQNDIEIKSQNSLDQLAVRFAIYHLMGMTPAHDARMGVGAKALSGEGYKGHSFWDTELFILPYFTYSQPQTARKLLEYRYHTLMGARKKAKENGYKGAMYPWESAWMDDGEVTPVWGAADIITGKATKIWSGFIEQHITSDVSFAVWQYFQITGDEDFMEQYGYEILLDTGIFWASRLNWNAEKQRYHIDEVIGPDEYKEHVNNDAFTNHTAHWCIENAISYYHYLKQNKPDTFARLNAKLNLDAEIKELEAKLPQLYVPQPNHNGVIPQDDKYLTLKEIDLAKYKNQAHVGSLFLDYSLDQVNQIQVSKQASVVMLMYLLEHKFNHDIKRANFDYYEPRTLHDSSLSLSTHAIVAADMDDHDLSYELFQKAKEIDLGPNMKSSDHGIHAASIGGIWQIIVNGYGGVRLVGGQLRIEPKLPADIAQIKFSIHWQGQKLQCEVTSNALKVSKQNNGKTVEFLCGGQVYALTESVTVAR
jgi:hypothetical glycosyl hydrolase